MKKNHDKIDALFFIAGLFVFIMGLAGMMWGVGNLWMVSLFSGPVFMVIAIFGKRKDKKIDEGLEE